VGDEWLTPEQLAERQKQGAAIAAQAGPLIAAGKFADAGVMVDKALQASPNNPALQYLKGVVLFRQGQKVPARKAFEAVEVALPDHMPTHNNLAVILWQTRAQMPAIGEYEKAMVAEPESQTVLDNLAEALHELPPTAAKNEMVRRVAARFVQQDAGLQKKMLAERGLKRLGSQWIPAAEFDAMQAAQKAAQEKMEALRKEATDLPSALNQLDHEISIRTDTMRAIQQQSMVIDAYGHIVEQGLPQHFYELKQEAEAKNAERALKQRRMDQLPKLMAEAQQQLSAQEKYTGKQMLIEEAGMPGAPRSAAQPSTRPS
ncbi:MAG TPA: tetratricopeptide repeat protein, partial [Tepidisphaeraceae bacterium]